MARANSSLSQAIVAPSQSGTKTYRVTRIPKSDRESQALDSGKEKLQRYCRNLDLLEADLLRLRDDYQCLVRRARQEQNEYTTALYDSAQGRPHSPLWEFCWRLRENEWLRAQPALWVFRLCTFILDGHEDEDVWALHFEGAELCHDEAEIEFVKCWRRVKFHPGFNPVTEAFRTALLVEYPDRPRLVSRLVCGAMRYRQITGSDKMFLSQEAIAQMFGCKQQRISDAIAEVIQLGVFARLKRGSNLSKTASEYRFFPDAVPEDIRAAYAKIVAIDSAQRIPSGLPAGSNRKGCERIQAEEVLPEDPLSSEAAVESDCQQIYTAYPRHLARCAAIPAIQSAIKMVRKERDLPWKDAAQWLLDRTKLYAKKTAGSDAQLLPYPAKWFKEKRYDDDPAEWRKVTRTRPGEDDEEDDDEPAPVVLNRPKQWTAAELREQRLKWMEEAAKSEQQRKEKEANGVSEGSERSAQSRDSILSTQW